MTALALFLAGAAVGSNWRASHDAAAMRTARDSVLVVQRDLGEMAGRVTALNAVVTRYGEVAGQANARADSEHARYVHEREQSAGWQRQVAAQIARDHAARASGLVTDPDTLRQWWRDAVAEAQREHNAAANLERAYAEKDSAYQVERRARILLSDSTQHMAAELLNARAKLAQPLAIMARPPASSGVRVWAERVLWTGVGYGIAKLASR